MSDENERKPVSLRRINKAYWSFVFLPLALFALYLWWHDRMPLQILLAYIGGMLVAFPIALLIAAYVNRAIKKEEENKHE